MRKKGRFAGVAAAGITFQAGSAVADSAIPKAAAISVHCTYKLSS